MACTDQHVGGCIQATAMRPHELKHGSNEHRMPKIRSMFGSHVRPLSKQLHKGCSRIGASLSHSVRCAINMHLRRHSMIVARMLMLCRRVLEFGRRFESPVKRWRSGCLANQPSNLNWEANHFRRTVPNRMEHDRQEPNDIKNGTMGSFSMAKEATRWTGLRWLCSRA
jgi:hypothetical protein